MKSFLQMIQFTLLSNIKLKEIQKILSITKVTHLLIKTGRDLRTIRKLIKVQGTTNTTNEAFKNFLKRVIVKNSTNFAHTKNTDITTPKLEAFTEESLKMKIEKERLKLEIEIHRDEVKRIISVHPINFSVFINKSIPSDFGFKHNNLQVTKSSSDQKLPTIHYVASYKPALIFHESCTFSVYSLWLKVINISSFTQVPI